MHKPVGEGTEGGVFFFFFFFVTCRSGPVELPEAAAGRFKIDSWIERAVESHEQVLELSCVFGSGVFCSFWVDPKLIQVSGIAGREVNSFLTFTNNTSSMCWYGAADLFY